MAKSIFLIICLLVSCHALFENAYSVKALKSFKKIRQALYDVDQVALLYFWADDCENCERAISLVEKIADDNEGLIKVFQVDCGEAWKDEEARSMIPLCEPSLFESLPQISFFQPPLQRINHETNETVRSTEHRFQGEASPKSLSQFGHKLMHAFRVRLTTLEDFEQFQAKETKLNKVILFTEKKETAAIYKAFSQLYLQRLHFAEVVSSPESAQLLDLFDIEEFPQLYLLEKKEDGTGYTRERYEDDLTYKKLKTFLEQYTTQDKVDFEHPEDIIPQIPKQKPRERRERKPQDQEAESEQKEQQKPKGPTIIDLTIEIYEKELLKSEKPALVHIYQNEVQHKLWDDITKKYKSLFNYYVLNVTSESVNFAKEVLSAKQFPTIRFFSVGNAQRKKITVVNFINNMDFEEIQKDILDLIEDKSTSVNLQEFQMKVQSGLQENKVCIVFFYNSASVGLTYRVFSAMSQYQNKFKFLSYKNPSKEIMEQFQAQTLPQVSLVIRDVNPEDPDQELKQDQIKLATYTGQMLYDEFADFLSSFDPERQQASKLIQEIITQEQFEEICVKKSQLCFIGLLNSKHKNIQQDDDKTRWEHQIEIMNKIKNRYASKPVTFVYIDALCHDEILLPLDLSDDFLPNYISYSSLKNQFSKMIGIFDQDSISRFIDNQLKGRNQVYNLSQKLTFKTKDCQQILAQREQRLQESNSNDEDDDILKEILEENRLKREQLEKELKQEKKKLKKDKKNEKNAKKNEL